MSYLFTEDIYYGVTYLCNLSILKLLHDCGYDISSLQCQCDGDTYPSNLDFFIKVIELLYPGTTVSDSNEDEYVEVTLPFFNPEAVESMRLLADTINEYNATFGFWYDHDVKYLGKPNQHTFAFCEGIYILEYLQELIDLKKNWKSGDHSGNTLDNR